MQPVTNQGSWCWTWLEEKGCSGEKREQYKGCDNNVLSNSGLKTKPNPSKTSLKDCRHFSPNDGGVGCGDFPKPGLHAGQMCCLRYSQSVLEEAALVTEGVGCRWWRGVNHITGVTQAVFIAILRVLRHVFIPSCSPASVQLLCNHFH